VSTFLRTSSAVGEAGSERAIARPRGYDFEESLRYVPFGRFDPTCRLGPATLDKAARTPAGPVALRVTRGAESIRARAWGPGAAWALDRAPALLGLEDSPAAFSPPPGRLARLARHARGVHLPRIPWVFDSLVRAVLQQRVAFRDAVRAHRGLTRALDERAPGPLTLLLPLAPRDWLRASSEDFRRAGVDGQRARTLRAAARVGRALDGAFNLGRAQARARLATVSGCGPWTTEMTMGFGLGDPDAVPVGDLHLPRRVAWSLAAETSADDARMLALLEPYRGQRFRVIRLLQWPVLR